MMSFVVFFFVLIASVQTQTVLEIAAAGSVPGGSAATASGIGRGQNVVGDAIASVTDNAAFSSTLLTATGPANPTPRPNPIPAPQPQPALIPVAKPAIITKQFIAPVCSDIKDKQCPKIDDFKKCGFCLLQSYPIKGYACDYKESYVLKSGDKKIHGVYEAVITPLCKCDGKFITEGKACPSCDKLLSALLKCAGSNKSSGVIEIPEKCLKQVGATEKILKECGFFDAQKKGVVAVPHKKPVVVVKPQKYSVVVPGTVVVPATSTPTATATATATGTSTSSVATSFASGGGTAVAVGN